MTRGARENAFKARLNTGETQIGLWVTMGAATPAEIAAGAGYDWLVVDTEHTSNTLTETVDQLRAIGTAAHAVVRPEDDDRAGIKRLLDSGAQTVLIPMIESGAQAQAAVDSVRYPPKGARGVAGVVRASDYGARADYMATADAQTCLLLQVESRAGLDALDDILAVEGVDGVFIGPADLSASLGYPGQTTAPEVLAVIDDTIARIKAAGVAAGILITDPALAKTYQAKGVDFLAVGIDAALLRQSLVSLRDQFR